MNKIIMYLRQFHKVDYIYATFFSLMCILSRHIIDEPADRSTVLTTYVTKFGIVDILIFIILYFTAFFVVQLVRWLFGKIARNSSFFRNDKTVTYKQLVVLWLLVFLLIILMWAPYMMSYWPGGIYNDTLDSIHIALHKAPMNNQNTVLYALWWRLIFFLGIPINQGDYGGLKLMSVLQPAIMAGVGASFVTWLRRRGVRSWLLVLIALVYAFAPIFPSYAVSMWKDTLFSVNLFMYVWVIYIMVDSYMAKRSVNKSQLIIYCVISFLIIFGRNNGIYIVILTGFSLCVFAFSNFGKKEKYTIILTSLSIILISLIIQGPVYRKLGVIESNSVEKYGIPLQQVAYMVSSNAIISEDELAVIEGILPKEGWINLYNPIVVDSIKFDPLFNSEYFDSHITDFLGAYIGVVAKNPFMAFKGYLLSTIGFWDAWKSSSSAYICTSHCWNAEYFMSDYFVAKTGKSLSDIVGPRWYISSGLLVWIMLLALCLILSGSKKQFIIPLLPLFALWLTLLMATPVSFSFRYVFSFLLCIPMYILCINSAE